MNLAKGLQKDFRIAAIRARRRAPEFFGHQARDFINGYTASEFPGIGAAHAIAHGKNKISFRPRGLTVLAEVANFVAIKFQRQKTIFVDRANMAAMRQA